MYLKRKGKKKKTTNKKGSALIQRYIFSHLIFIASYIFLYLYSTGKDKKNAQGSEELTVRLTDNEVLYLSV